MQKSFIRQIKSRHFSASESVVILIITRLLLLSIGFVQDRISNVPYTDIDFTVFMDAATMVNEGVSPYERTTYRYSPFYAEMMSSFSVNACRSVLCAIDTLVTWLSWTLVGRDKITVALISLSVYPAVIASRGNADCVVMLMVVLGILAFERRSRNTINLWVMLSGFLLGLAIHLKLFPIIYTMAYVCHMMPSTYTIKAFKASVIEIAIFSAGVLLGFAIPTVHYYNKYGFDFIQHTYLYHLNRLDARHNVSPYFYLIYLSSAQEISANNRLAMSLPQILGCAFTCVHLRSNLKLSILITTIVFVAFNKVCTCQYYVWWMYLLPLVVSDCRITWKSALKLTTLWLLSQQVWMYCAYRVEFLGQSYFTQMWVASLVILWVNIYVAVSIVKFSALSAIDISNESPKKVERIYLSTNSS